jgi:hypothetical protein
VCQWADVERYSIQTIRHRFDTVPANSVSNPRVAMALTGHKLHQAYLAYVHGDGDQAPQLADQIGAFARACRHSQRRAASSC